MFPVFVVILEETVLSVLVESVLSFFVDFLVRVVRGEALFYLGPGGFHFQDLPEAFELECVKPFPPRLRKVRCVEAVEEFGSYDRVVYTYSCGFVTKSMFPKDFQRFPGKVSFADTFV